MKKFLLVFLISIFLISTVSWAAAEVVTITLWGWSPWDEAFKPILPEFYKKYPNIKVDIKIMSNPDVHNKLLTSIAAGAGAPDICGIEIAQIAKFASKGGLVDLLKPPFNAGKYEKVIVPYKWHECLTSDGRLIAFPWDIGPAAVFYRRDLFQKAGLPSDPSAVQKLLSTWDKYIDVGKKITISGKQWMIENASSIFYIHYAHQDFFDRGGNVAVDSPRALKALTIAKKVRELGLDAKVSMWTPEWQALIPDGKIATQIVGCWFGGFLKTWLDPNGAGKWGIVPVPETPGLNWGGSNLAIPEQSKHKEEAWKFIEFALARKTSQIAIYKAVDFFPALTTAWNDPIFYEPDPYFGGQKQRLLFINIAKQTPIPVVNPNDPMAEPLLLQHVAKCLDQGIDPAKALKDAADEIRKKAEIK